MIKISVIITSFNAKNYLDRSITSFLAQDYENKELLIIDGKSNDGSHEIIKKYHEANPELINWIKDVDSGISNARNIAVKHATGDLIGFLGADDVIHKNFLSEAVYYAGVNPKFDVMYFDGYGIAPYGSSFRKASDIAFTKRNLIKFSPIAGGECFYYKKDLFDKFSFNEKNKHTMDYEFNMAIVSSKEKYSFFGVAIPAIFNISDGTNISGAMSLTQRAETIAIQLKYTSCLTQKIKIILRRPKFCFKNWKAICNSSKQIF